MNNTVFVQYFFSNQLVMRLLITKQVYESEELRPQVADNFLVQFIS